MLNAAKRRATLMMEAEKLDLPQGKKITDLLRNMRTELKWDDDSQELVAVDREKSSNRKHASDKNHSGNGRGQDVGRTVQNESYSTEKKGPAESNHNANDAPLPLSEFVTLRDLVEHFFGNNIHLIANLFRTEEPPPSAKLLFAKKLEMHRTSRAGDGGGFKAAMGLLMWWLDSRVVQQLKIDCIEVTKSPYDMVEMGKNTQGWLE